MMAVLGIDGRTGRQKNYALVQNIVDRIKAEIFPLLQHVRDRRKPMDRMWNSLLKVWTLEHEYQGYQGHSNIYVPAGRKGLETLSSQLVSGTFPSDENFGVEARTPMMEDNAALLKEVLKQRVDNAKVRVEAEPFYRGLGITGNSPMKITFKEKKIRTLGRSKSYGVDADEMTIFSGPVAEPVDIGNLYFWPENVNRPDQAEIVFQDMTVAMGRLRLGANRGLYSKDAVANLKGPIRKEENVDAANAKLSSQGLTTPHDTPEVEGWGLVDIIEIYCDFDFDAETKEDERNPVPCRIVMTASGEVLRATHNPWWHQQPPFLLGRMGTLQGRIYGTGYLEAIRELNMLLNDQVNQGMDAATYALNPIVLTNPNLIDGNLANIEPGVQWLVHDINNAVKMITPPMEVINGTSILSTQTMAWINDFVMAPPVLQGGSSPGKAFRTATGIGTAQQNAKVPLNEVIRLCETEVWEPMLFMFHMLDQQYADQDFMVYMNGGKQPVQVSPSQLNGQWMFRWLASTQTANQQMKGAQITQLLQVLTNPGLLRLLMQRGLTINPAPLIKRLYQEVLGFRDVNDVMVQAALGAMGMPVTPDTGSAPSAEGGMGVEPSGNPEMDSVNMEGQEIAGGMGALANGDLTGMGGL